MSGWGAGVCRSLALPSARLLPAGPSNFERQARAAHDPRGHPCRGILRPLLLSNTPPKRQRSDSLYLSPSTSITHRAFCSKCPRFSREVSAVATPATSDRSRRTHPLKEAVLASSNQASERASESSGDGFADRGISSATRTRDTSKEADLGVTPCALESHRNARDYLQYSFTREAAAACRVILLNRRNLLGPTDQTNNKDRPPCRDHRRRASETCQGE